MGHARLTHDCSLNLMFPARRQKRIELMWHRDIKLFIWQGSVVVIKSCVIPGIMQVQESIITGLNKQLVLEQTSFHLGYSWCSLSIAVKYRQQN